MNENGKRYKVLSPVKNKDGRTFWVKMGIGFPNQDGSTNIFLDGLPVNGKLQLRDWDEPPWDKKDDEPAVEPRHNESLPF